VEKIRGITPTLSDVPLLWDQIDIPGMVRKDKRGPNGQFLVLRHLREGIPDDGQYYRSKHPQ